MDHIEKNSEFGVDGIDINILPVTDTKFKLLVTAILNSIECPNRSLFFQTFLR